LRSNICQKLWIVGSSSVAAPGIEIPDSPNLQRLWDAPIINKKFNEILDSSDHCNKARLLAVSVSP
jgi:hypothetical protein